jgi:hypothetical protein
MPTYGEIKEELVSVCEQFSKYPEHVQAKVVEILGNYLTRDGFKPTAAENEKPKKRDRFDRNPPKMRTELQEALSGSPSEGREAFAEFCEARAKPAVRYDYQRFALSVFYWEKVLRHRVDLERVFNCWTLMNWDIPEPRRFRQQITSFSQEYNIILRLKQTGADDIRMSPAGTRWVDELRVNPNADPPRRRRH